MCYLSLATQRNVITITDIPSASEVAQMETGASGQSIGDVQPKENPLQRQCFAARQSALSN